MNAVKKTTTPKEEKKPTPKPVLTVSKPVTKVESAAPSLSVNDRIERAEKFDKLIKRREVLKGHKDTFDNFMLSDTGFGSALVLENEQGAKMPIRNPDALKQIYPLLDQRIVEALTRVDAEILAYEV